MGEEAILALIDKLAEKLGVAADKVQPIAVETLAQISLRGWAQLAAWVIISVMLAVVAGLLLRFFVRCRDRAASSGTPTDGWEAGIAIFAALCLILVILCGHSAANALSQAVAPLPYVLGL